VFWKIRIKKILLPDYHNLQHLISEIQLAVILLNHQHFMKNDVAVSDSGEPRASGARWSFEAFSFSV